MNYFESIFRSHVHYDFLEFEVGVCEDYQEHKASKSEVLSDMRAVSQAGASLYWFALAWDGQHEGPGEYDWSFWDTFFRVAEN